MNTAGDSADHLMSLYFDGMEHAFKIAGVGAKNIAAMICAMLKENQQTKGKTRLTNMLKTGKELKIYTFKVQDLKKFSEEAKKYGVLYCALANKKNQKIDGEVDIMIREEDAAKVNRIAERFEFANVDRARIASEIGLDKEEGQNPQDIDVQTKSKEDILIDDILSKPIQKEEQQQEIVEESLPSNENTEEKSQLENSLNTSSYKSNKKINKDEKKSVKEELREIEQEIKEKEALQENTKELNEKDYDNTSKEPKHLKQKENKEPKHLKKAKHFDYSKNKKKNNKHKRKER
ncbi:MAG: PcfB family protein [Clostridia bacterium]|nr:PcfB family protein [Clostridia bacterium]